MKEDYLWDKTGSDAEIEKLETALRIFRCEETAPPVIPAKVLPFVKKESPRRSFPFLRAIAACLALTSISLGVWILISNTKKEIAGNVLQKSVVEPEFANPIKPAIETEPPAKPKEEVKPTFKKTLYIEPKSSPKSLLVSKSGSKNGGHNSTNRKVKNTEKTIRLTEEEKYAYEQLMLALSITSRKLKLVKEKVDGTENQAVVLKPKNNNSGRK
jgi:hypothetical protein